MRRPAPRQRENGEIDPDELNQQLDDSGDFQVEAQPDAEATEDREAAETEPQPRVKDVGDLYGVHLPPASDRDLDGAEDQESFRDSTLGETFVEELITHATEGGPTEEHLIDVVDDSDADHPTHHATESRDRPVADKGSGGPGGV
jgi:hypothetical protein